MEFEFKNIPMRDAQGDDLIYADLIKHFLEANQELIERHANENGFVKGASLFDVLAHTLGTLIANIPVFFQEMKEGTSVADILTEIVEIALNSALHVYAGTDDKAKN